MPEKPDTPSSPAEPLANEILAGAERRAKRLRAREESKAESIVKKAEKEAQRIVEEAVESARSRAEHDAQRIRATIGGEERAIEINARQKAIDEMFDAARETLSKLDTNEKILTDLCVRAVEQMPGDSFTAGLAKKDRSARDGVVSAAKQRLADSGRTVNLQPGDDETDIIGGVIVRSPDGSMVFDNSYDARLERAREQLRTQIAEMIFANE